MFNHDNSHKLGEFKVRVGPMFSGKTSRVISFAYNNEKRFDDPVNRKLIRILMVRPARDTNIKDPNIFVTHGNHIHYDVSEHENVDVVVLGYEHENALRINYSYYDLYIFDEGQFFHPSIASILSQLVLEGREIYFTALLHDFNDKVFPTTQAVMTLPEVSNIKKLYNQCSRCGRRGYHSARLHKGRIVTDGPQVLIGDDQTDEQGYSYIGICTYCKKQELGQI